MENRIYNFNPGPAMQPLEVLQEAQDEFLNFAKSGMSIIEISHRSKQYEQVHNQAKADIKELMGLGDDYEVLFCQGGASMQFTMIPQNFAVDGKVGNYVLSGSFATKAYDEANTRNYEAASETMQSIADSCTDPCEKGCFDRERRIFPQPSAVAKVQPTDGLG